MNGILGKKIGMTQIYAEDGAAIPVTVVKAGPCLVVQRKTQETDGYEAVQLGLVEDVPPRKTTEPRQGHFKKAGVAAMRRLAEFSVDTAADLSSGDQVKVSIFSADEYVDVIGTSKGKGFQGVMKRHGFGGGKASHGSQFHRQPGSIGQSAWPAKVFKGIRLPGHMGDAKVTVKNLRVVKVDEENHLLYIRGAVPGACDGYLMIRRAKRS